MITSRRKTDDPQDLIRQLVDHKYPSYWEIRIEFEDWLEETVAGMPIEEAVDIAVRQAAASEWHLTSWLTREKHENLVRALQYEAELQPLPLQELQFRFDEEIEEKTLSDKRRKGVADDRYLFFSKTTAAAEYDRWLRLPHWTIDEAVALCLGKDPREVTWEAVQALPGHSPFRDEYAYLRERITRAVATGSLNEHILPLELLNWAKQSGITYPSKMDEVISAPEHENPDWENLFWSLSVETDALRKRVSAYEVENEPRPHSKRERDNLLRVIISMAIGGYGYNPLNRNNKSEEISGDVARLGMDVGAETIRNKLRQALELIPPAGRVEIEDRAKQPPRSRIIKRDV